MPSKEQAGRGWATRRRHMDHVWIIRRNWITSLRVEGWGTAGMTEDDGDAKNDERKGFILRRDTIDSNVEPHYFAASN